MIQSFAGEHIIKGFPEILPEDPAQIFCIAMEIFCCGGECKIFLPEMEKQILFCSSGKRSDGTLKRRWHIFPGRPSYFLNDQLKKQIQDLAVKVHAALFHEEILQIGSRKRIF